MKKRFNKKDLLGFRDILLKRRAQLTGTYEHFKADALNDASIRNGDLSKFPSDEGDAGSCLIDQAVALNVLANEADQIGMIDEALARIKLGSFGCCERCQQPIPKARLKVLPFTKLCVKCRQAEELDAQGFAG